jgi:accessory gene regulator B
LLSRLSCSLATYIIDNNDDSKHTHEEIEYGLKIILNSIFVIISTLIPSFLMGWYISPVIVLVNFALLRFFSGGYHIKSSTLCVIASSSLMISIIYISKSFLFEQSILWSMFLCSLLLILVFAPFGVESHLKININNKILFKVISAIIVIINFAFIHSELVTVTYFFQSLTIIGKRS